MVDEVVDVNSVNPVSFTGLLLVVSKIESLYENIFCCFYSVYIYVRNDGISVWEK